MRLKIKHLLMQFETTANVFQSNFDIIFLSSTLKFFLHLALAGLLSLFFLLLALLLAV